MCTVAFAGHASVNGRTNRLPSLARVIRRVWQFTSHIATLAVLAGLGYPCTSYGQQPGDQGPHAENVVLITLDGLRGEEFFEGIDRRLAIEELGVDDREAFLDRYDGETPEQRRNRLMPFLWQQIESGGWVAGYWKHESSVRVTNGRNFSYPGYNELLCGYADPEVDSNAKRYNRNVTVLEWLHGRPGFQQKVYAFASWDVFPFIINDRRSGIPVNAGWMELTIGSSPDVLKTANLIAPSVPHQWESVRYDVFTAIGAVEAMKSRQPRVLYVALGETDDWAHAGRYDRYIASAQLNDRLIRWLWETAQSLAAYRDRTVFLITTDHGRGDGREGWKSHGASLPGSERIWVAAFGPTLQRHGNDRNGSYTQAQIAATVAALLGEDFQSHNPRVAPPLPIAPPLHPTAP